MTTDYKNITMFVEVEGKACVVAIPQSRLRMLLSLAQGLCENGQIPIHELPENYKLELIDFGDFK